MASPSSRLSRGDDRDDVHIGDHDRGGALSPLARVAGPVREQLAASLRDAIGSGRFTPGERLVERELCEQTGASRTAVREALRQLEGEGFVTLLPQQGCVVTRVTRDDAVAITAMRSLLEGEAVRLFAEHADDDQLHRLEAAHDALDAAYARDDFAGALAATAEFDAILYAGCGNPYLGQMVAQIQNRIAWLRRQTVRVPGRTRVARRDYRRIRAALSARDGEAARAAMAAFIERWAELAVREVERWDPPARAAPRDR